LMALILPEAAGVDLRAVDVDGLEPSMGPQAKTT
jgi:hypothetical protein